MLNAKTVWNWIQDSLDAILLATLVLPVFLLYPCHRAHALAATSSLAVTTDGHDITATFFDAFDGPGEFALTNDNVGRE